MSPPSGRHPLVVVSTRRVRRAGRVWPQPGSARPPEALGASAIPPLSRAPRKPFLSPHGFDTIPIAR